MNGQGPLAPIPWAQPDFVGPLTPAQEEAKRAITVAKFFGDFNRGRSIANEQKLQGVKYHTPPTVRDLVDAGSGQRELTPRSPAAPADKPFPWLWVAAGAAVLIAVGVSR